jgi:hypothetical protein
MHPTTVPPPLTTSKHHPPPPITTVPPLHYHHSPTHYRRPSISHPFPYFSPETESPQNPNFSPNFLLVTRTNREYGVCVYFLCWIYIFLQGVGVDFSGVCQTLVLRLAHQVFDKLPQLVPACLGAKLPLPDPTVPNPEWPNHLSSLES